MRKNKLPIALFALLTSISSLAIAGGNYPAADFQPEVVFQDHDYIAKKSSNSANTAPAKASAESVVADSKYPAANFKPEVVYQDSSYKGYSSVASSALVKTQSTDSVGSDVSNEKIIDKKAKDSGSDYLLVLLAVGVVGFFLFKNQSKTKASSTVSSRRVYAAVHPGGGMTGVARYVNKVSGTGVTRYLEKQAKSVTASQAVSTPASTGVARYMEKNAAVAKSSNSGSALTGVDKYLRGRG